MEITGKKAVIVGGASGMARASAQLLHERGAAIAILDLPASAGDEAAKELGGTFHPVDVTDDAGVEQAVNDAADALGGIHISVNTAGGGTAMRTLSKDGPHPIAEFRRVIELNLIATFNLNRLQAFHMAKNEPEDGERGVMIDTASIAAFEGQIGQVAYTAAKAGHRGDDAHDGARPRQPRYPCGRDRAEPVQHRYHEGHPRRVRGGSHQGRGVPEADGPARGIRPARVRDRREPDAQRIVHPARRGSAFRAEVI